MGLEIERKYLVKGDAWRKGAKSQLYRQGYLTTDKSRTVRIRAVGKRGTLTIKGITRGVSRTEFEYDIPFADANSMLDQLCLQPLIEKKRYRIQFAGHMWEVDEFLGKNEGLITAEIELNYPDEPFESPVWLGPEVTRDSRYCNSNLVQHPFSKWKTS